MQPFITRNFINRIGLILRVLEEQKRQRDFADDGFQLFAEEDHEFKLIPDWPFPVTEWKAYGDARDLDELEFEVSHVSAVRGGFGVRKARVKHWGQQLADLNNFHPALLEQLEAAGLIWLDGSEFMLPDEFEKVEALTRRFALWERYRATVPYHQIGAANGDNLANRPLTHRTWHGNLGNFGVGWALDVGASEELEDWHIETGRASLRTLTARILKVSAKARRIGVRIAPHRAFSPSRRGDTGANVHREIIVPASKDIDALEIDYHMSKGKGLPIPNTWDPAARFDRKGKVLPR